MKNVTLQADCGQCSALCCISLAFDRSPLFAIDKAAGQICPNLDECGACSIHSQRTEYGFRGCVDFDCLGAGQRVTQEIFNGRTWMEDRSLLGPMTRAFSSLRQAHEYLLMLNHAERLNLSAVDQRKLADLRLAIEELDVSIETVDTLKHRIDGFLSGLRTYVGAAPPGTTNLAQPETARSSSSATKGLDGVSTYSLADGGMG